MKWMDTEAEEMEGTDEGIIEDINVTPLVDIVLVLLIIFMVTATYIVSRSIPVDLPKASTGEEVTSSVAITITKDGSIFFEGEFVDNLEELKNRIHKIVEIAGDVRVIISADKDIPHGRFVSVVNVIREAGASHFAINVKEEDITK